MTADSGSSMSSSKGSVRDNSYMVRNDWLAKASWREKTAPAPVRRWVSWWRCSWWHRRSASWRRHWHLSANCGNSDSRLVSRPGHRLLSAGLGPYTQGSRGVQSMHVLTYVGFRAHVKIASRIVSYRSTSTELHVPLVHVSSHRPSIGSSVLSGLALVTERQTDGQTCTQTDVKITVAVGHMCLLLRYSQNKKKNYNNAAKYPKSRG